MIELEVRPALDGEGFIGKNWIEWNFVKQFKRCIPLPIVPESVVLAKEPINQWIIRLFEKMRLD